MSRDLVGGARGVLAAVVAAAGLMIGLQSAHAAVTFLEGPHYTSGHAEPYFNEGFVPSEAPLGHALLNDQGIAAWRSWYQASENVAMRASGPANTLLPLGHLGVDSLGYGNSVPTAINASGTTVGNSISGHPYNISRAVRWSAGGVPTALQYWGTGPSNGDPGYAKVYDINDAGMSVGWATKYGMTGFGGNDFGNRAVRWDAAGNIAELEQISFTLQTGEPLAYSTAYAINNNNVAVGNSSLFSASNNALGQRAVRWNANGQATQLGALGIGTDGVTYANAWAINGSGDAIGYADKYDAGQNHDGPRAVRWNHNSADAIELENLGLATSGYTETQVYNLNEAGTMVGSSLKYNAEGHAIASKAVRWNAAGQVTELADFGVNGAAYDINDGGFVVGTATQESLPPRAVYWNLSGNMVDLNTLISSSDWLLNRAWAVSNTGWIVGVGKHTYDADGPGGADPIAYDRVFMMHVPALGVPGDFDSDGDMDGADFVAWQTSFPKASGATLAQGDADEDGDVDGADFVVWQTNFPITPAPGAAPVPEPATFILAIIAAILFRRRNDQCTSASAVPTTSVEQSS